MCTYHIMESKVYYSISRKKYYEQLIDNEVEAKPS